MTAAQARVSELAGEAIGLLIARGQTIAAAESLTGGLVAAALTSVPGSSAAFRGGVVAYATDLKAAVLGVPDDLLERRGAVDAAVAEAMAEGARTRMWTTVGVATTGVAGPDPAEGKPVGTVYRRGGRAGPDDLPRPGPDRGQGRHPDGYGGECSGLADQPPCGKRID